MSRRTLWNICGSRASACGSFPENWNRMKRSSCDYGGICQWRMPNVIVTSHQAFLTKEALSNIAATTVDNLLKFERGEPSPDTEVCYHCERKETCRKARDQKCF